MAEPSTESSGKHHGFFFHLWMILKPKQRNTLQKKTSFFRQMRFVFRRSPAADPLHDTSSGFRLKKIGIFLRRPQTSNALKSLRHFFTASIHVLKNTGQQRDTQPTTRSYSPLKMSLKHAAETAKRSIEEDADLLKTFSRMVFRLPNKPESTLPKFPGVKLLPGKTKNPIPRMHGFTLFFREPREAFFRTGQQLKGFTKSILLHWQQIAVVSMVFVFSLELSLQIASTATWLIVQQFNQNRPVTNESLLFIGDFFTSGEFGARDIKPYTDYLPQFLAKKNLARWNVVSYSAQHADVSNLLEVLPALIMRERPRIAYIMVGAEDLLSGPIPTDLRQQEKRIQQEVGKDRLMIPVFFRKWNHDRSFGTILDSFTFPSFFVRQFFERDDTTPEALQSALKSLLQSNRNAVLPKRDLFYQGKPVSISNDRVRLPDGSNWICFGAERYCEREGSSLETRSLDFDGANIVWNGPTLGETFVLTTIPERSDAGRLRASTLEAKAWQDLNAGDYTSARDNFYESIAQYSDSPIAHAGLAQAYYNLGSFSGIHQEISWLERKYQAEPGLLAARALAQTYLLQYSKKEGIKFLLQALKSYPENAWLWSYLAESLSALHTDGEAGACIRKALILTPKKMNSTRAAFFRIQSNTLIRSDPAEAAFCLVQAFALDGDLDAFSLALREHAERYQNLNLSDTLQRLNLSPQNKADLLFAFQRAVKSPNLARIVLFKHKVSALLDICKISGVEPVLVTYPIYQSRISEVIRTIAEQDGVAWLNLNSQFEILLVKENRNQKILRYGILTDEGSRRIAEMISADVSARVTAHPQY